MGIMPYRKVLRPGTIPEPVPGPLSEATLSVLGKSSALSLEKNI